MFPYVLLMFLPLVFSVVSVAPGFRDHHGIRTVAIGKDREVMDKSAMLPMFFTILFFVLALRHISIGRDLLNYKYYFEYFCSARLQEVFTPGSDPLYWLLNWVVGRYTSDYQVFLAVVAVISVVPIAVTYSQDRTNGFLKIVLFMNMSVFIMLFSGLRQAIAISMGLAAYECVKRKKRLLFLLCAAVALGFHHTAFVVFSLYPLYHASFKKKDLLYLVPLVALVFVFSRQIFGWATSFLSALFGEKYTASLDETGAYTMLILYILFAVLAFLLPDEESMDKETVGLRNIMLVAVLLQCFAPVHMLAMRMNYYYIIFIPMLMPKILKNAKQSMQNVAQVTHYSMVGFFMIYYLTMTYNSCRTGVSALDTYPYVPFWKG